MKALCLFALVAMQCLATAADVDSTADGIGRLFRQAGLDGTFLLLRGSDGAESGYRPDRWDSGYSPASTFKIFNSLVALETRAVADAQTVIPWDRVDRGRAEWNRDQTMASAYRVSAVWFYQELARRIGPETMQFYLDTAGYGNKNASGPIDRFWLDGTLRITPRQQVRFLQRLHRGELPFSRNAMERVKAIMIADQNDVYVLRAKTGLGIEGVGWYVGYVVRKDDVYFFATMIRIVSDGDIPRRKELSIAILRYLAVL